MRSTPLPRSSARKRPRACGSSAVRDTSTRERLVEAAARTVADLGFSGATVREICRRARANVAAVNYHFGSKRALLAETLRWACSTMPEDSWSFPAAGGCAPDIETVVAGIARRLLSEREEWHTRLMLRAMLEPNPAIDLVVRDFVEPRVRLVEAALAPSFAGASPRKLRLAAISVIAQIAYWRLAAPIALRLLGDKGPVRNLREEIAVHVADFTRRAMAGGPAKERSS